MHNDIKSEYVLHLTRREYGTLAWIVAAAAAKFATCPPPDQNSIRDINLLMDRIMDLSEIDFDEA